MIYQNVLELFQRVRIRPYSGSGCHCDKRNLVEVMVGSGVAEGKSQLFYVEGLWKRVRKGSLRIEGHGRENIIGDQTQDQTRRQSCSNGRFGRSEVNSNPWIDMGKLYGVR